MFADLVVDSSKNNLGSRLQDLILILVIISCKAHNEMRIKRSNYAKNYHV